MLESGDFQSPLQKAVKKSNVLSKTNNLNHLFANGKEEEKDWLPRRLKCSSLYCFWCAEEIVD
jgi:hypothetical protein